jgi:hypothetical protein
MIRELCRWLDLAGGNEELWGRLVREDEQLFGVTCAASTNEFNDVLALISQLRLSEGKDFVFTLHGEGVQATMPDWLVDATPTFEENLKEFGFSHELWAKFDHEVKAHWLNAIKRQSQRYAFKSTAP